ncbi:MAG: LysR family transcriptional regulator [Acetobacteraceae bacterium]|nr:LysR family transcriptional regulator [Acetobacteraceae bacterium]
MTLRDLHILAAVVHWGSMARGAAHLGLSQPSVSEAVAKLEAALCVRLLDRSPRGVEPTMFGRTLLRRAHVVFDELKQSIRDIEFLSDPGAGEVRIGCPESLSAGFVPAVIDRLSRRYPRVSVRVLTAQAGEQEFRELRNRSVDLLIGRVFKPVSDDDVEVDALCEDGFFVAAGSRTRWARRPTVTIAELLDEPWILFPEDSVSGAYIAEAFRSLGLPLPRRALTSFSPHLRLHLVSQGRFLTMLHGSVLRFNAKQWSLKALRTDLLVPPMPIAIFTLKNRTLSPVVGLFIEQAREAAALMGQCSLKVRSYTKAPGG